MNGPSKNLSSDWRAKWPEPEKLEGSTARHVETRKFYYIESIDWKLERANLVDSAGERNHKVTLEQLATYYNIVPEDRL